MRKCVLIIVLAAFGALAFNACKPNVQSPRTEACDLLQAVPSDALCVGLFDRLDRGLENLTDTLSPLRRPSYGKLSHARCAIALCNIGSLSPLLVIEAGKASEDTIPAVRSLLSDSLDLYMEHIVLSDHNALIVTPSETVLTVALRHISSGTSILDAPGFERVAAEFSPDAVLLRNRGAAKLYAEGLFAPYLSSLKAVQPKDITSFLADAAEWTLIEGDKVQTFQPESEKYFCTFLSQLEEAQSKLSSAAPDSSEFLLDIPIASYSSFRNAYAAHLDAKVQLEGYEARLKSLGKAAGKNPRDWEKELGVKEVALAIVHGHKINMVRTSRSSSSTEVEVNPYKGFVSALYGSVACLAAGRRIRAYAH